jgi:hypothetical protein
MRTGWLDAAPAILTVLALAVSACGAGEAAPEESGDEAALGAAPPAVDPAVAQRVLFLDAPPPAACNGTEGDARVRCLISARYAASPSSRDVALDLYAKTGDVAGVGPEQTIDGGYRGMIHLVPELPVGTYAKHLVWAHDAMADFDRFFDALATQGHGAAPAYRWRGVNFRFFRSVGRTTPSAYVEGNWEAFYNVSGGLNTSASAVRETLFHELFHINDDVHDEWSSRALAPIVNAIAAKCGTKTSCLAPYTPTDTQVKGGTYYAFQPNQNPLEVEYSAELATRYYQEQRAKIEGRAFGKPPFKCGPPENGRAWDLLAKEFFGGADLVPACP